MNANQDHAPLLTAEDLHAMTDDALREIIRLCASQSRIYRAAPVYLPWYRLGAQALAELDNRAFEDKMIFEHDRDLKAEVEERAHEDELDDSAEIELNQLIAEQERGFKADAEMLWKTTEERWKTEEEERLAKIEAAYRAARKAPPLGPEIKF